jgi:hypothetical protein
LLWGKGIMMKEIEKRQRKGGKKGGAIRRCVCEKI